MPFSPVETVPSADSTPLLLTDTRLGRQFPETCEEDLLHRLSKGRLKCQQKPKDHQR
jgi:hypothetical protein